MEGRSVLAFVDDIPVSDKCYSIWDEIWGNDLGDPVQEVHPIAVDSLSRRHSIPTFLILLFFR